MKSVFFENMDIIGEYDFFVKKYFFLRRKVLKIGKGGIEKKEKKKFEDVFFHKELVYFFPTIKYILSFFSYSCRGNGIHKFYFSVKKIELVNKESFFILNIEDIFLEKKSRSKGIGSQFMIILEEICRKNNISYILANIQSKKEKGDFKKRIHFFQKNGFKIIEGKSFYSGFGGIKKITLQFKK